ncbi:MAG: methionyl-tRNA formyltransferase [Halieaceae bacterium]|jgi:methionyl-tRNA formyltransferase
MRIVFAGTPAFAAIHLQALSQRPDHQIVGVYTQPDRRAGRGKKLSASPVKQLAKSLSLEVYQPVSLRDEAARAELEQLHADIMVVVAYGLLLPEAVLDTPRLGCINVHASLLPRWRGAAPVQRAIEAGDSESGVTIMQMDVGLDTGAVLSEVSCRIAPDDSSASLLAKMAALGPDALIDTLQQLEAGTAQARPQDETTTCYAAKIEKAEALINWPEDADTVARKVRAFNPFPISYTYIEGERVKVWRAEALQTSHAAQPGEIVTANKKQLEIACGNGLLSISHAQFPGGRSLAVGEFMNARSGSLVIGKVFGSNG